MSLTVPTGGGEVGCTHDATSEAGFKVTNYEVGKPLKTGGPIPVMVQGKFSGITTWSAGETNLDLTPFFEYAESPDPGGDPPRNTLTTATTSGDSVSGTAIAWDIQCHVNRAEGGPVRLTVNCTMDD